jgi:hypothetical protein
MSFVDLGQNFFFFFFGRHFWKCCKQEHQRRQANVVNKNIKGDKQNVFNAGMDCGLTFLDIVGVNYDAILLRKSSL